MRGNISEVYGEARGGVDVVLHKQVITGASLLPG